MMMMYFVYSSFFWIQVEIHERMIALVVIVEEVIDHIVVEQRQLVVVVEQMILVFEFVDQMINHIVD